MKEESLVQQIKTIGIEAPPPPTASASYSPIPLIHALATLYRMLHNAIRDFPKQEKFSIGETMERILLECVEACFLGTTFPTGPQKFHHVATASAKFDALKLFIRICIDIHCLKEDAYVKMMPLLASIGTMLGGWMKQTKTTGQIQNRKQC